MLEIHIIIIKIFVASAEVDRSLVIHIFGVPHQHEHNVLPGDILACAENISGAVRIAYADRICLAPEQSVLIRCARFDVLEP